MSSQRRLGLICEDRTSTRKGQHAFTKGLYGGSTGGVPCGVHERMSRYFFCADVECDDVDPVIGKGPVRGSGVILWSHYLRSFARVLLEACFSSNPRSKPALPRARNDLWIFAQGASLVGFCPSISSV
jgi:hypothetical protein